MVNERKLGLSSASIRACKSELIRLTSEGSGSAWGLAASSLPACSYSHAGGRGASGWLLPSPFAPHHGGHPQFSKHHWDFFPGYIEPDRPCRLDHCTAPVSRAGSVPTSCSDYPRLLLAAGPPELQTLCSLASLSFGRAQTWFPSTYRARGSNHWFLGA